MENILNIRRLKYMASLLLAFVGIFMINSCKDEFLDNPPQGTLTEVQFPETAPDARRVVNGMYSDLRVWQIYYGGFPIVDIMSDDANKGSSPGDGARMLQFETYSFFPDIVDLSAWYTATYEAIKSVHVVLDNVPNITMDETEKSQMLGQARFLRALHYFQLARGFGDIPKVTNLNPPLEMPRSPVSEIYNEIIIPDLLIAVENLPTKSAWPTEDLGRATKGAAQALLAKTYLYVEDYPNAALYAMQVVNSGQYDLEATYENAFLPIGQFGIESVFEVGAIAPAGLATGGNQFANTQGVRGVPNRGWGFNRPSVDLINSFETGDPRMDETIIFVGETLNGILIEGDESTPDETFNAEGVLIQRETYSEKVWVPGTTTEEPYGYNVKEMRYAEVLLIAAEALNKSGNPAGALTEVNKVRARVGLDPLTETDQTALDDLIFEERRHEMAMEQERYFDLVRTGRAAELLSPLGFVSGKHETFPIPASELLLNRALVQSSGW